MCVCVRERESKCVSVRELKLQGTGHGLNIKQVRTIHVALMCHASLLVAMKAFSIHFFQAWCAVVRLRASQGRRAPRAGVRARPWAAVALLQNPVRL